MSFSLLFYAVSNREGNMTVGAIERKAGPYNYSDGAIYPFYFKVFSASDVVVIKTDSVGAESELVLNNDFTVSLNDNQDNNPGGNVSLSISLTDQHKITISSGVQLTQETVITNQGGFYPAELNKAFDKLTILCQQLLEQISRCIKTNISSTVKPDELLDSLYESASLAVKSQFAAAQSAEQAAESAGKAQQISDQVESRATEIVKTATNEATSQAEAAAASAEQAEVSADEAKLHAEIANQRGIPVGTVVMFSAPTPPPGYLMADGTAVGRETYPDLFAAIGTVFGEGDGETTFNLPDLIDRFAQGSNTPGQKIEAGLPNITGGVGLYNSNNTYGATRWHPGNYPGSGNSISFGGEGGEGYVEIDARGSSPIYGASDTVQPPALTLLPCIKAFDAAVNPGLVDMTGLANDVAGLSGLPTDMAALSANKLDKSAAFAQDQTWQTPSRVAGTIYTNTTGRAITVSASHSQNGSWSELKGYVNGVVISTTGGYFTTVSSGSITFIVPNGSTYTVTGNVTAWRELR